MSNRKLIVTVASMWGLVVVLAAVLLSSGGLASMVTARAESFTPLPQPVGGIMPLQVTMSAVARQATTTPVPAVTLAPTITLYPTFTPVKLPWLQTQTIAAVPNGVNPLTGLTVSNPALLERRVIQIKTPNYPRSVREVQSGLSMADVVWEHFIGDGMSRYVQIYYGNDASRAGPIRSGRFVDEHLMRMYGSIFVYANADPRVKDYLTSTDLQPYMVVPGSYNCPPICRDTSIEHYNNVFIDTSGLDEWLTYIGTDNARQPLRMGTFNDAPPLWEGTPVSRIYVRYSPYSYNAWEYDVASDRYLRWQDTADAINGASESYAPLIDNYNQQRVAFDNVVVLFVKHNWYDKNDEVFDVTLVGSGPAHIFRNGQMYIGQWMRDAVNQPIVITNTNGSPMALKPGTTFYAVINDISAHALDGDIATYQFIMTP